MKKIYQLAVVALSVTFFYSCVEDPPYEEPVEKTEHEGHGYVDLGLPSGALWSTEELCVNGSYFFSWAETDPKDYYHPSTYKFGTDSALTKYCTKADYGLDGKMDGLIEMLPEDDPVVKHWGGKWCMPNWNELEELYLSCTWTPYVDDEGKKFYSGISKYNGKEIIIPTTGAMVKDQVLHANGGAFYWSSTLLTDSCSHVAGLAVRDDGKYFRDGRRIAGHCVRPVIPGNRNVLKMVDLGLPSGVKWANGNIGAVRPTKAGIYYAWGESLPKTQYTFEDYKYCSATNQDGTLRTLSKYVTNSEYGNVDNLRQLEDADDVAQKVWGNGWRMPTLADINELLYNCEMINESIGGLAGTTFIGPNGNKIFLPWAGTIYQGTLEYTTRGYYWSSTLASDDKCGEGLFISERMHMLGNGFTRCSGRCVRAVHD